METSWKKIILRFCIIVIIIFSASYVVGEYREYKEQQEIGTQLEREEVSTEVRNEVLTGKAGVKDKLLGYEDVNLTRLYIYVHAYNQMVEEDERIIIDDVNSNKENEIGNIDGLSKEFLYSSFSDNYDIKEYMNAKLPFDYFEEDRETTHHIDAIETFIYRVASGRLNYEEKVKDYEYQIRLLANEYMAENPEIKCELNEYGNVEIYDLSIEQVNELIRKYDLKELFKKHIALYIVTLLAAFGCWALHMLSEYVPDNGITPVAYPVMIAVYVIVCVVLFIVSIVFVILYFRRSTLKDEGYLTHTLPVPVWLIYVCKLISGYIIYLVNFVVIIVSVCISIARVDWIWRVPESINEQLNVLGYKGSFCTLIIILIILSGIYMYAMFFFCMCMGYTANGNRDAFSFVTYIAVYIVGQILNVIVLLLTPIKGNGNMFEEMIKESVTGSDVAFTFEEFGHIMTGSVVVSVVMFIAFVVASIYILDKKLNLE